MNPKKIISALAIIFVIIFSTTLTLAQNSEKPSNKSGKKEFFTFGPKVTLNFTSEKISKDLKSSITPGAEMGLFFRISPTKIYIQPEINYVIKNATFKGIWNEIDTNFKHKSHHINIPLLVGYKIVNAKILKLRVFAGPEFSFKVDDNLLKEKFWSNFHGGFQAGLGVDIWRFTIDAGYSFLATKNLEALKSTQKLSIDNVIKVSVGFKCY